MTRIDFAVILTAAAFLMPTAAISQPPDDAVLRSMQDELERSRKLAIPGLEKPYFIQYSLDDARTFSTSASLGASLGVTDHQFRIPRVRVRVGDPSFDNTNYIFSDLTGGSRFDPEQFPVDDNYAVLRHDWWLATDRAYKGAVEAIARKRAALKNITQPEVIPDLWAAKPMQKLLSPDTKEPDWSGWPERIRSLSGTFSSYPEIISSGVRFNDTRSTYYLVNSEGTTLRRPEPLAHLQVQASAFTPDGMTVHDALSVPRIELSSMPRPEELRKRVEEVAKNVQALAKAPAGEAYSGPVLFDGIAGPQVFAELLAPNLALGRRPVGEPGRQVPFLASELEGRLESRILPEFIDIVDDPAKKEWKGAPLLGSYEIDEEGTPANPLTMVEKGRLKSFLLTRQPVKGFEASNGRARLPGPFGAWSASISNLFIHSSESVKGDELRKRFLRMLQDRNKPWGIIVRKMDFPSGASNEEARRLIQAAQQSGVVRPVSAPLLIFKVFPDGREELVRGLRFRGFGLRSLRDIVAVSEETFTLDYLNNGLPFALLSGGGYVAPVSVIAPSLLFDELELEHPRNDTPTLPIVPAPPLTSRNASR